MLDYPDSLYQDHWEGAEAYGVVSDSGELLACIEVCPEEWSNRLMVTLKVHGPPMEGLRSKASFLTDGKERFKMR